MPSDTLLVYNIAELISCEPLARQRRVSGIEEADLGRQRDAWLLVEGGRVSAVGAMPVPAAYWQNALKRVDAAGCLVLPGLIDSHTHPLFAGARYLEFAGRLDGLTYQEIAARGGGIKSSVQATRAAAPEDLLTRAKARCQHFLSYGVTSLEVKSGYGLGVAEELRQLGLLQELKRDVAQCLRVTCLALHAASPEYPSLAAYSEAASNELLPQVAAAGLADYVDAFIEQGYFSVADCEPYMRKAQELGLGIRVHADEFSDAGAAAAAARWQAASADHLQHASSAGIAAMAAASVIATILPGTSLYTAIPFTNARRFTAAGCAVAIASDFNPGSCWVANLPMLASMAGLHCGLKTPEIIAGVTYVAATALGLAHHKGALAPGLDADFLIHPLPCLEAWLADVGQTRPREVWIKGQQVCLQDTTALS